MTSTGVPSGSSSTPSSPQSPRPDGEAAALSAAHELFGRILDSTPDGIMVIDPDRRIRFFNRACGELLGRDPREVMSSNCVCGQISGCKNLQGASLAGGLCPARDLFLGHRSHQTEEMRVTNAAGEERWIETTYSAIRGADGGVEFVVGVLRDVHHRRTLEARLRQNEKMASLGQLTAGIAHEIKNPLGIIQSAVEVLLDGSRPEAMRVEAGRFLKDEVRRLDSRLRAFLAFARPNPPQREPMVMDDVVGKALGPFRTAYGGFDVREESGAPCIISADPDQLHQLITNLLLNAAEAQGGERGRIAVGTSLDGGSIALTVDDGGPGIPPEILGRVLDPFFTTKAEGTGLGLCIVYQIATAHGGTVELGDSPLGGARVTVRLPVTS